MLIFRKRLEAEARIITQQNRNNPLLPPGKKGEWDEVWATWASVVRLGPKNWRMYYTGRDRLGHLRIGLAFSKDGLVWQKYHGNPILDISPQEHWDSLYVYGSIVLKESTSWRMVFTGCDSLSSSHYQIGLALSSDGVSWTKFEGNPVFDDLNSANKNRFGQHETEGWGLIKDEGGYYLLYNPVSRKPRQIWIAHSTDLIAWKPLSTRPLLPSTGFPWQLGHMKYCAWPFRHKGYTYLVASVSNKSYTKSRLGLWRILGALSSAGHKEFMGYIVEASGAWPWCEMEVDAPYVLEDSESGKFRCYYGGRSRSDEWSEGLIFFDLEEFA